MVDHLGGWMVESLMIQFLCTPNREMVGMIKPYRNKSHISIDFLAFVLWLNDVMIYDYMISCVMKRSFGVLIERFLSVGKIIPAVWGEDCRVNPWLPRLQ